VSNEPAKKLEGIPAPSTPTNFAFAVPGDLATPTGGYRYDRRDIEELRALGCGIDVLDLGSSFPFPSVAERSAALAILSQVPRGRPIVIDGLAFGVLPEAGALRHRTPLVALVHQPLALDAGLDAAQAKTFRKTERIALAAASQVVVTSETTARIVKADYNVGAERIHVVRPGNDPVPQASGSQDGIVRLISVGSVVPGKGYDVLISALASLIDLPWRLTIAGDLTRDVATAAQLDAAIQNYGLKSRVAVLGAVNSERLAEFYLAADIFVLASRFESYGMALTEAIAHGLPVVSTRAGAIPYTVPANSSLLVPPDDTMALADALRRLIVNEAERHRLARNACAAGPLLPTWADAARRFAGVIEAARQTAHAIKPRRPKQNKAAQRRLTA
jgi:glycosyltransferase involved in cell wall biosynthesis